MPFVFEQLEAYQRAREWVALCLEIEKRAKGYVPASILDQLVRATHSIPLNLAEGCGRWGRADKQKFYQIALGSVYECAAIIQLLVDRKAILESHYKKGYDCLASTGQLINGLIRSVQSRPRRPTTHPQPEPDSDSDSD